MEDELKTREDIIADLKSPFQNALNRGGITEEYLVRKLKQEFNAKEPKIIKVKGAVDDDDLPRGYKKITTSGTIITIVKEDGFEQAAGDGDTIIQHKVNLIGIRQKARMDSHKLRGDYPAEKRELTGPNGEPIEIKYSDTERIARILTILENSIKRKKDAAE